MNSDPLSQFRRKDAQQPGQPPTDSNPQARQPQTDPPPKDSKAPEQGRPPELQTEPLPVRPAQEIDKWTGKEVYHAYHAQGRKSDRLEIRKALQAWRAPAYRYLMDVTFNGHFETELSLLFTFYTVTIKGRHLDPIIYAIEDSRCVYIQEYHAEQFAPFQQAEPFIESIVIDLPESARQVKERE